jgi:hypothetical protein
MDLFNQGLILWGTDQTKHNTSNQYLSIYTLTGIAVILLVHRGSDQEGWAGHNGTGSCRADAALIQIHIVQ